MSFSDPQKPRPNPDSSRFAFQIAELQRRANAAGARGGAAPYQITGAGSSGDQVTAPSYLYQITESDGYGRYSGTPVYHKPGTPTSPPPPPPPPPASPTFDTFPADGDQLYGPPCDKITFPLVEVNGRPDVPIGSYVDAWPSPSASAMLFRKPTAYAWVRVTATYGSFYYGVIVVQDPATLAWSDIGTAPTILVRSHGGYSLQITTSASDTARYLAVFSGMSGPFQYYVAVGDADEAIVSGSPVYSGGMLNTITQTIKGEKTIRDLMTFHKYAGNSWIYIDTYDGYAESQLIAAGVMQTHFTGIDPVFDPVWTGSTFIGSQYALLDSPYDGTMATIGVRAGVPQTIDDTLDEEFAFVAFTSLTSGGFYKKAIYSKPSSSAIYARPDFYLDRADDYAFGVMRVDGLRRGIDHDFLTGEYPIVRGGLVVGYFDGVSPPPPPPPIPPVPTTPPVTVPPPSTYDCSSTAGGGCVPNPSGTGAYSSLGDCEAACGYWCTDPATSTCIWSDGDPGGGATGPYSTGPACVTACVVPPPPPPPIPPVPPVPPVPPPPP